MGTPRRAGPPYGLPAQAATQGGSILDADRGPRMPMTDGVVTIFSMVITAFPVEGASRLRLNRFREISSLTAACSETPYGLAIFLPNYN